MVKYVVVFVHGFMKHWVFVIVRDLSFEDIYIESLTQRCETQIEILVNENNPIITVRVTDLVYIVELISHIAWLPL